MTYEDKSTCRIKSINLAIKRCRMVKRSLGLNVTPNSLKVHGTLFHLPTLGRILAWGSNEKLTFYYQKESVLYEENLYPQHRANTHIHTHTLSSQFSANWRSTFATPSNNSSKHCLSSVNQCGLFSQSGTSFSQVPQTPGSSCSYEALQRENSHLVTCRCLVCGQILSICPHISPFFDLIYLCCKRYKAISPIFNDSEYKHFNATQNPSHISQR